MAKFSYEISIPNQGTFVIDSDKELNDSQAYQAVLSSLQTPLTPGQEFTRGAGIALRGAAPVIAGTGAGFAVGGAPGAVAGGLALPLAEMATQAANVFGANLPSPTGAVEGLMTKAGLPVPETRGERVLQNVAGAVTGAGTQLPALARTAQVAVSPTLRGVAGAAAEQPVRQLAAAAPAAAASQVVGEEYGAVPGMVAGMAASAPFAAGAKPKQVETIPSIEQLKQTSGKLYKFAEDAGVAFKRQDFTGFVGNLRKEMFKEGLDQQIHPTVYRALERMSDIPKRPITLEEIDILRRVAGASIKSNNADERRLGAILTDRLDGFVEGAGRGQLVSGNDKAIEALGDARQLWKQGKKAQILENIFDVAELRSEANYTQSGMEQALRSRLVNLAANEKAMRQFNKTEQAAIRDAAKGGDLQNFFRYVGKLAPTSVIPAVGGAMLGTQMFGTSGAVGAAAPAVIGAASRAIATRQGLSNFQNLENMLRLGRQPRTPVSGVSSVITRGLISPQTAPLDVTQEELNQIYGR